MTLQRTLADFLRRFCGRAVQFEGRRTDRSGGVLLYRILQPGERAFAPDFCRRFRVRFSVRGLRRSGCGGPFAEKTLKELIDGCPRRKISEEEVSRGERSTLPPVREGRSQFRM